MKPTLEQREMLVKLMKQRQTLMGLNSRQIADLAEVDPAQTWRILNGDFRTIGGNLLRICSALGVDPHDASVHPAVAERVGWSKLKASLLRAWDNTPQGADQLAAVINAVANVAPRRRPTRQSGSSTGTPSRRRGRYCNRAKPMP